jgi:hypothetical protein
MEIDDIFASKGKLEPIPSSSTAPSPVVKKKKKKRQKQKQRQEPTDIVDTKPAKKRPVPETVVDPSTSIPPTKRLKGGADEMVRSFKSTKGTERDDEERFKDSRGSGPRLYTAVTSTNIS